MGSLADWRFDSDNPRNYKDSKQGKSFPSSGSSWFCGDSNWVCRSENRGSVDFFQTGTIISGSCADFVFVGAYTEI